MTFSFPYASKPLTQNLFPFLIQDQTFYTKNNILMLNTNPADIYAWGTDSSVLLFCLKLWKSEEPGRLFNTLLQFDLVNVSKEKADSMKIFLKIFST